MIVFIGTKGGDKTTVTSSSGVSVPTSASVSTAAGTTSGSANSAPASAASSTASTVFISTGDAAPSSSASEKPSVLTTENNGAVSVAKTTSLLALLH